MIWIVNTNEHEVYILLIVCRLTDFNLAFLWFLIVVQEWDGVCLAPSPKRVVVLVSSLTSVWSH